jgi:hypothetical protein
MYVESLQTLIFCFMFCLMQWRLGRASGQFRHEFPALSVLQQWNAAALSVCHKFSTCIFFTSLFPFHKNYWQQSSALLFLINNSFQDNFEMASVALESEFLSMIQMFRFRFPASPDFLSSIASGTGPTQTRVDTWGATWKKKKKRGGSGLENRD